MKIIRRKEAKALGLKVYFTGKPCLLGHTAERYAFNGACKTCGAIRSARYQKTHPAIVRELAEKRQRNYRLDPAEYLRRKYVGMSRRIRGYCESPHLYKGLGIINKVEFMQWAISDKGFLRLWKAWSSCGYALKHCPSIDRIDTQRGYVAGNLQFITQSDNSRKACEWKWRGINQITKAA